MGAPGRRRIGKHESAQSCEDLMRTIRLGILVGLLGCLLLPTRGVSQFPGGSPGGKMSFLGDPGKLFDMMSGGKDVITRDSLTNPWMAGMFDRYVEKLGITDGKLTRDQFNHYMQQRMAEKGIPWSPTPSTASPSSGAAAPNGQSPSPNGGMSQADMIDRWAESMFRRYDQNGDGLLNYDEMPESLRIERDKWDTNKDGFIDLNEFKAFFKAALQKRMEESAFGGPNGTGSSEHADPVHEEEPKPAVYRAGKLPKELPAWFKQLDTDGDGQISLYEWRSAGKSLEEFHKIDRNGDGFLTITEVLYYVQGKNNLNGVAVVSATPTKNGNVEIVGSPASASGPVIDQRPSDSKSASPFGWGNRGGDKGSSPSATPSGTPSPDRRTKGGGRPFGRGN
jgi:Ca2+-binding EF-hand superfamily protein